jgi:hypothetical protein
MFGKLDLFPSSGEEVKDTNSVGSVKRSNPSHCTIYVSKPIAAYIPEVRRFGN